MTHRSGAPIPSVNPARMGRPLGWPTNAPGRFARTASPAPSPAFSTYKPDGTRRAIQECRTARFLPVRSGAPLLPRRSSRAPRPSGRNVAPFKPSSSYAVRVLKTSQKASCGIGGSHSSGRWPSRNVIVYFFYRAVLSPAHSLFLVASHLGGGLWEENIALPELRYPFTTLTWPMRKVGAQRVQTVLIHGLLSQALQDRTTPRDQGSIAPALARQASGNQPSIALICAVCPARTWDWAHRYETSKESRNVLLVVGFS